MDASDKNFSKQAIVAYIITQFKSLWLSIVRLAERSVSEQSALFKELQVRHAQKQRVITSRLFYKIR
jgi:hypothetical protein